MPIQVYLTKLPVHVALNRSLVVGDEKNNRGWDVDSPRFRHRAVMGLFPEVDSQTVRADLNVLFRYEVIPGQAPYFLVQSGAEPVGGKLKDFIEVKLVEQNSPSVGTPVAFRLAVNTIRREDGKAKPIPATPHDPLTNENPATEWVREKLSSALQDISFTQFNRQVLGVNRHGQGTDTRVVQVDTVEGVATVRNPSELEVLLLKGVGRAKSYGCGLLSVMTLAE